MGYALGALLFNLILALAMVEIAQSRGRNGVFWGGIGLVLGLLGLIILLFQEDKKKALLSSPKWIALKNGDERIKQAAAEVVELDPTYEIVFAERLLAHRDIAKIPEIVEDIKSGEYVFWKKVKKPK